MKKLFSSKNSETSVSFSLLVLRVSLGFLMLMVHGFPKLNNFKKESADFADPFHIGSTISLSLTIFAEFFCAALIVMGLLTRLATIPLIIAMSVALFYVNHGNITGGGEKAALYLFGFVALLFAGPGKYSLDRAFGK
jgi:putative oxidoreductase